MNADGTIAGAQGLNLTDGSGRMIPVNLSVSIQMPSLARIEETAEVTEGQVELEPIDSVSNMETIYSESDKIDNVVDILSQNTSHVNQKESRSGKYLIYIDLYGYTRGGGGGSGKWLPSPPSNQTFFI